MCGIIPYGKVFSERDVLNGKYGNGHETRKKMIGCDDATYQKIRKRVNELSK